MKAIRIAALGALLLVSGAVTAHAQDGRRGGNRALNGIELTDAQKTKLEEIQKKYQPEMQALRESAQTGDRAEAMKKFAAIREKQFAEFRAILTPAQQAVFDKHIEELKEQRAQMQNQGPPSN
jgi:Spy/CpxP family protein refolding chaperone